MECLLCYFMSDVETLKVHYEGVHNVDPTNFHFRKLFESCMGSVGDVKCTYCACTFTNEMDRRKHSFLRHYNRPPQQFGGSRMQHLNILRRDRVSDFSINFEQHRRDYNFFAGDIVPRFLDVVYRNFQPEMNTQYKFQGFCELLNWRGLQNENHPTPSSWLTRVYCFSTFNRFVRENIQEDMQQRIVNNRHSGSSWRFFRYQTLKVLVAPFKYGQRQIRS